MRLFNEAGNEVPRDSDFESPWNGMTYTFKEIVEKPEGIFVRVYSRDAGSHLIRPESVDMTVVEDE